MENQVNYKGRLDFIIRMGLLLLLVFTSLMILAPFIIPLIWGIIIAVALYPIFNKTVKLLNGKKTLVAVTFTLVGLLFLIVPAILLTDSTINGYRYLSNAFEQNEVIIPQPREEIKEWPIVGEEVYKAWKLASVNFEGFFKKYSSQLGNVGSWLVGTLTGLGLMILEFILSLIVAGVLLAKSSLGEGTTMKIARRLVGDQAEDFVNLTSRTIRSVVQGIVGIAIIQAVAAAILMLVAGIPFAGLWALLILILAIMQLPPLLVLGPAIIYAFSTIGTVGASVFTAVALLIGISDNILKPLFLGRGVDIPMLVILLGAIGGMLVFGILGLFVGAVIVALSYKLMLAWMNSETTENIEN